MYDSHNFTKLKKVATFFPGLCKIYHRKFRTEFYETEASGPEWLTKKAQHLVERGANIRILMKYTDMCIEFPDITN